MDAEEKKMFRVAAILVVAVVLIIGIPGTIWSWYKAGVQQQVYQRQGVEMTQWEVFIGTKPIERPIKGEVEVR